VLRAAIGQRWRPGSGGFDGRENCGARRDPRGEFALRRVAQEFGSLLAGADGHSLDRELTEQRLIEAVGRLLARSGFAARSINALAHAAAHGGDARGQLAITARSMARLSWMTLVRHCGEEGLNISR